MIERKTIWRDVLVKIATWKPGFTAGDVADEFDLTYAGAAQLLKRLQTWGCLRVTGYDAAVHQNPGGGGGGRRRKAYEVTDHGRRKVDWINAEGA